MGETIAPRLVVVSERDHRFLDLGDAECSVGRAPENQIVLKDDMVSRKHCTIEKTANGYRVRDLKSFNGTYLNGERIQDEPLKPWDSVRVGRTRIFYVTAGGPPPPTEAISGGPASPAEVVAAQKGQPEAGELTQGLTRQMPIGGDARFSAALTDPGFRAQIEEIIRRERTETERQIGRRLRDESAPGATPVSTTLSARARRVGPLDGGGDFYDVLVDDRDPDALLFAVGTVSGQGIAASIAAAGARHAFQGVAYAGMGDMLDRLARLRDLLVKTLHPGTAISVALARGLPDGKIRLAATGGAGALIYRASRKEIEVARPVARRDSAATRLDAFDLTLATEDRLLIASDGAGSVRTPGGGDSLGSARLAEIFLASSAVAPGDALGRIMDALVAHGGGQVDRDATTILVSRG